MRRDYGVCKLQPHIEATIQEEKADDDRFHLNSAIGVPLGAADVRECPVSLRVFA